MKAKNLLLVGLAGFALSSCGSGLKGYKNEVAKERFVQDLGKVLEENPLFNVKSPYSFEEESSSESKMVENWYIDTKSVDKQVTEESGSVKTKYDSVTSVLFSEGNTHYSVENAVQNIKQDYKGATQYQVDSENYYVIDKTSKLYTKTKSAAPKDVITLRATSSVKYLLELFYEMADESESAKYFKDNDVYTMEITSIDDDENTKDTTKSKYQLVVDDNGFELHSESHREVSKLSYKKVVDDRNDLVITKKDGLKVENLDLHDYLLVQEFPDASSNEK